MSVEIHEMPHRNSLRNSFCADLPGDCCTETDPDVIGTDVSVPVKVNQQLVFDRPIRSQNAAQPNIPFVVKLHQLVNNTQIPQYLALMFSAQ